MAKYYLPRTLIIICCLLLGACANQAPRVEDFQQQRDTELQQLPAWSGQTQAQEAATLLMLVDAPQLRQLINQALASNPDLHQTLLTLQIRQAEQTRIVQRFQRVYVPYACKDRRNQKRRCAPAW